MRRILKASIKIITCLSDISFLENQEASQVTLSRLLKINSTALCHCNKIRIQKKLAIVFSMPQLIKLKNFVFFDFNTKIISFIVIDAIAT